MRRALPLGVFHPGTSLLHRLAAGPKLTLLFAYGVVALLLRGPWTALATLAFSLLLAVWARIPPRTLTRGLRPIVLVAVFIGVFQVWQRGWPAAFEVVVTIVALVVAATVFTATTPLDQLLDAIVRGLRPFRRVGVNPDKVALAFSLMIRAVPDVLDLAHETRDAARARGLERDPRTLLVPMALRTVAHAQATGDALTARGLGDD